MVLKITKESHRLYLKIADRDDRACRDVDPSLFSPPNRRRMDQAQSICNQCPVQELCLDLGVMESHTGVWGGEFLRNGVIKERPFAGRFARELTRDDMEVAHRKRAA